MSEYYCGVRTKIAIEIQVLHAQLYQAPIDSPSTHGIPIACGPCLVCILVAEIALVVIIIRLLILRGIGTDYL